MAKNVPTNTIIVGKHSFEVRFDVGAKAGILNMIKNLNGGTYFKSFPQLITPTYDETEIVALLAGGSLCAARMNGIVATGREALEKAVEDAEAAWIDFKADLRAEAEPMEEDEAIKFVLAEKQKVADQIADAVRYDEGFPKRKPKGMPATMAAQLGQSPGA